jgi:hypothetical protein
MNYVNYFEFVLIKFNDDLFKYVYVKRVVTQELRNLLNRNAAFII